MSTPDARGAAPQPAITTRPKVAIYADEEIVRAGLAGLLSDEDIEVILDGRLEEAGRKPPVGADVMIVATGGPKGAGVELARRLARIQGSPSVILLASAPGELDLPTVLANGAAGGVCRSCSGERVARSIRMVTAGGVASECLDSVREIEHRHDGVLSDRERRIVAELARGASTEEVAERLWLSPHTVRTHIRNIVRKLGARTRTHAVAIALSRGEVGGPDE